MSTLVVDHSNLLIRNFNILSSLYASWVENLFLKAREEEISAKKQEFEELRKLKKLPNTDQSKGLLPALDQVSSM